MKKPTIRDVSLHAGVSMGTVSRVLNAHENVDEELRARVLDAVSAVGYERSRGRDTRTSVAEIDFLLVLRDVDEARSSLDLFWAEILHGAGREAAASATRLSYRALHGLDHGRTVLDQLGGEPPRQVLLVGPAPQRAIDELRAVGSTVVLIDNTSPGIQSVVSDSFDGTLAVVDHLLDLGHTRIAYLAGPASSRWADADEIQSINQRSVAYRHALERRGLAVDPDLIRRCDLSSSDAERVMGELLDGGAEFSAVFAANDPAAAGAIRALRQRGRSIPDDVSVAGFDDQFDLNFEPRLTTARVDRAGMGALGVRVLLDLAAGRELVPAVHTVPVEFVAGASTAAASSAEAA